MIRPPVLYYGAKTTVANRIVELLPLHGHYVEPYAGSLSVLLAKAPSVHETVNDLDGDLMTFWKVLRDNPEEFERACALTPHSRAEYAAAADLDGCTDLERARRVWVRLTQGRAGTLRATGWRHYCDPGVVSTSMPGYLSGYRMRMQAAAARLARVSLECQPALEIITKYGAHQDVCLYVDPPYLGSVRSGATYVHEMRSADEHRALLEALAGCQASVVLSGYASELYDDALPDWSRYEIRSTTGNGGSSRDRVEVVWVNRPGVATLFDQEAS